MTEDTKKIVEIHGVKMEVDLRHAKRIEEIRIGDAVKVLTKDYSGHKVSPGVVVGFEPFENLPTIIVAYVSKDWSTVEMKFLYFNSESKETEIIRADDNDLGMEKDHIIHIMESQIKEHERQIEELRERMAYFQSNFAVYWSKVEKPAPVE